MKAAFNRRAFLGSALAVAPSILRARQSRPNIVLILADDMGYSDLGCFGGEIETPNLDRLAAKGVRFTHFYNAARCCPSRSALMTGLYPHQAGVGHMLRQTSHPGYQSHLADNCVTIAEALRGAGYSTMLSGKWHLGAKRPHWPVDRGFDHFWGLISGASNYFCPKPEGVDGLMAVDGNLYQPSCDGFYMTDAITEKSVEYVKSRRSESKPFFLYTAYTAPHWPLHAKPEDIRRFRGRYNAGWDKLRRERWQKQIRLGVGDGRWKLPERDPQVPDWSSVEDVENWDLKMAVYAAQVHSMDRGVGRILAALESSKLAENTVVMFLSDNGGCHEELDKGSPGRISNGSVSDREYWSRERAQRERPAVMPGPADSFTSYMRPWAYLSNTPFQQYKRFVHEGGISTPLIVSAPGLKQGGRLIRTPGHIIDVMPTCLELAGARYPAERNGRAVTPVAGRSLVPLLGVTSAASRSTLFWEHEGNAAVRDGDWKVVRERGRDWELYNMSADRTETSNLAGSDPARLKAMVTRYEQWAAESNVLPWEEVQKLYGSAR